MACQKACNVLLGFKDEYITEEHNSFIDFSTNKIGGKPDWHQLKKALNPPQCRLCGSNLPLLVQIYAPLEGSKYHRTLYVFACVQPLCWNHTESWVCIRQQSLCTSKEEEVQVSTNEASSSVSFWNAEADNWDSDEDLVPSVDQENGNVVVEQPVRYQRGQEDTDTDDSSISIEEPVDPNANSAGAEGAFAVEFNNKVHIATAEIEIGDETDIVSIDTPTRTRSVSQFFVQQNCKSWGILHPEFVSSFIYVQEEFIGSKQAKLNDHEMSLLQQYQQSELGGGEINLDGKGRAVEVGGGGGDITGELYEKEIPMHGDVFAHRFISRIQQTPGQILRYGRGTEPLLLKALPRGVSTQRCQACNGEMVFEMQLLPALLSRLRLTAMEELGADTTGVLEFGTVLVYTCRDSCWSPEDAVYREEKLVVQAEST